MRIIFYKYKFIRSSPCLKCESPHSFQDEMPAPGLNPQHLTHHLQVRLWEGRKGRQGSAYHPRL